MNTVSLFAKHVGVFYLDIDTKKILNTIKKEKYYINHDYLGSQQSESIEILNKPEFRIYLFDVSMIGANVLSDTVSLFHDL